MWCMIIWLPCVVEAIHKVPDKQKSEEVNMMTVKTNISLKAEQHNH